MRFISKSWLFRAFQWAFSICRVKPLIETFPTKASFAHLAFFGLPKYPKTYPASYLFLDQLLPCDPLTTKHHSTATLIVTLTCTTLFSPLHIFYKLRYLSVKAAHQLQQ